MTVSQRIRNTIGMAGGAPSSHLGAGVHLVRRIKAPWGKFILEFR